MLLNREKAMNMPAGRPPQTQQTPPPNSLVPETGWHCGHYFYRFLRDRVKGIGGREQLLSSLRSTSEPGASQHGPQRRQSYLISGHKADFAVMVMDPDPLKVNAVHQEILSGPMGVAIEPTWSFISVSEVSEYVPTSESFRADLIAGGMEAGSPELEKRVRGYAERLPMMNHQRLYPEFPNWPAACFYPMNKSRIPGANWFMEPFSHRKEMMGDHARSGMEFAGKVSQLITVGVGLDDWEWMVTLWARNPEYLKEIVYRMRFDRASAHYAEFGPFYTAYRASGEEILAHCRIV